MPELPEVETVRTGLQRLIPSRTIRAVDFDWPKSFPNTSADVEQFVIGATVLRVRRRAKVLMIDLSTDYSLAVHLKMTGQLVFVPADARSDSKERFGAGHPNDSLMGNLPDKSTRVTIVFDDGSTLFFNDQRKFGWMRLLPTAEIPNIDFMKRVGPEPLNDAFTATLFINRINRRKNSTVKAAILDQSVLAGVGNIYADESLFAAKIHPSSLVKDIPKSRIIALHHEIRAVLQLSIDKGGSTNKNYVNAEGKRGSYTDFAKVFRRNDLPCPTCGREIIKIKVAGRGTHVCTHCQKVYKG